MSKEQKLKAITDRLEAAIDAKDKKQILAIYDEVEAMDLENIDGHVWTLYQIAVSDANDILYA